MTATAATVEKILKRTYPQTRLPRLLFAESPLLGLVKKSTTFYGDDASFAGRISGTGGGSATFSEAQANISPNTYNRFNITHALDYSICRITTLAVRKASNNAGALVRTVQEEADGAMYTIGRSMARTMYGDGSGLRGQVAGVSTTALTLVNVADIVNFEVGMTISGSTTATGGTEITANTQVITGIDEDQGILYGAATWNGTTYADGNYLFRKGDYDQMAVGLAGWVPETAPTSGDDFFGQDRSVHVSRLAGVRYEATAVDGNIERALISATARGARSGAKPDHCFVHPSVYGQLINELGAKARYDQSKGQGYDGQVANFGFQGLCLHGVSTPKGHIMVHPDIDCPQQVAYLLRLEDWKFMAAGDLPGFLKDDGSGQWLRTYNADAMEARIGYYGNIVCERPINQIRVDLSVVAAAAA